MKDFITTVGSGGTNLMCDEMPLYIYLLERWFTELCCTPLLIWKGKTYTFHDIPLPKWPSWYDADLESRTNPQDYYGDLGALLFGDLENRIYQFCWKHTKSFSVPVSWSLLKPHVDQSTIYWVEEDLANRKKWVEEDAQKEKVCPQVFVPPAK